MPGFVLEEPFPLARFHNTIGEKDSKHFVVGLNALDNDASEDADSVAITVQGEGFKIYNVSCLASLFLNFSYHYVYISICTCVLILLL